MYQSFSVYTGESGLVYRGYINYASGKELVAVKTCKGIIAAWYDIRVVSVVFMKQPYLGQVIWRD